MPCDKGAAGEIGTHFRAAFAENETERCDMRTESVFGRADVAERLRNGIFDAAVEIVAEIDPRPAIMNAHRDIGEVIGDEVGTEHVAFVDRGP